MTDGQLALDVSAEQTSSAVLSDCGRYRYQLTRRWADGPVLGWVMLNPSTADANDDDPTIRRCIGFSKANGYGGLIVRNLYAYRATDPTMLVNADDPIGPGNLDALSSINEPTVAAWGAHPAAVGWWNGYPYDITDTLRRMGQMWCLGVTAKGAPRHPLYVAAATQFQTYRLS